MIHDKNDNCHLLLSFFSIIKINLSNIIINFINSFLILYISICAYWQKIKKCKKIQRIKIQQRETIVICACNQHLYKTFYIMQFKIIIILLEIIFIFFQYLFTDIVTNIQNNNKYFKYFKLQLTITIFKYRLFLIIKLSKSVIIL